jgi:hypothetical protein
MKNGKFNKETHWKMFCNENKDRTQEEILYAAFYHINEEEKDGDKESLKYFYQQLKDNYPEIHKQLHYITFLEWENSKLKFLKLSECFKSWFGKKKVINNDRIIEIKLMEIEKLMKDNKDGAIKSMLLYMDRDNFYNYTFGNVLKENPEEFDYFLNKLKKRSQILNLKYCFKYWWSNFRR